MSENWQQIVASLREITDRTFDPILTAGCEHGASASELCVANDRLLGEVLARDREIAELRKKWGEDGTD